MKYDIKLTCIVPGNLCVSNVGEYSCSGNKGLSTILVTWICATYERFVLAGDDLTS